MLLPIIFELECQFIKNRNTSYFFWLILDKLNQMKPLKTFLFFFVILLLVVLFNKRDTVIDLFNNEKVYKHEITITAPDSSLKTGDVAAEEINFEVIESDVSSFLENDSALYDFFGKLNYAFDSLVRIIYFGDSQIEGDLITYTLRKEFQQQFGGNGIGYMPAEMYFNTTEQIAIVTNDFDKTMIEPGITNVEYCYGLYGRFFEPLKQVSSIRVNNRSNEHIYNRLRLVFSGNSFLWVGANSLELFAEKIESDSIDVIDIEVSSIPSQLNLRFSNYDEFKIFGMLFDSETGVMLDHVPNRGSLNLMLNIHDKSCLKTTAGILHPALVVLHYGMNVIVGRRDSYDSYRIALERDIKIIQSQIPGVSVLIIGAADMAYRDGGEMKSYENIPAIIEAQRAAANNCNAAFWDMRAAMGGENSIIEWVERDHARTDYAHINAEGAKIIGGLLSADLLNAYESYIETNE
jgi:hypothetical protein